MAALPSVSGANGLGDFGKLAPELRNMIFGLCLKSQDSIRINGRQRTKLMRQSGTYFEGGKYAHTSMEAAKVTITLGGVETKVCVAAVVSTDLLHVSKAIHTEAAPMFYSSNHFTFSSEFALLEFYHQIGRNATHLARLEVNTPIKDWKAFADLRGVSKPTIIHLQAFFSKPGYSGPEDAKEWATRAWKVIKPIVSFQEVKGSYRKSFVELSKEKQAQRLNAFYFDVPEKVKFKGVQIKKASERATGFRAMLHELWRRDLSKM